jgi:maltooligosyltrehalose trehalohydrolase
VSGAGNTIGRLGAIAQPDGTVEFRVWAPNAGSVAVRLGGETHDLVREEGGVFGVTLRAARGDRYVYVLDGLLELPDPCSRGQPDGVHGLSAVLEMPLSQRLGVDLDELVIYELHVGTFSEEGTFDGVVPHLRGLRDLGVTAIELMPVATFPGNRGWGYDGVYTYAPHPAYGGSEGLGRLVQAAHREGLGVILDVVYNHIGPGADALTAFGPYLDTRIETLWGDGIDFSHEGVREWAIQNALMWVEDYGIDGLRLDAIHAIRDASARHVLAEIAQRVHETAPQALVIAETFPGDGRPSAWGHDAQWDDALHHALHALLTGEREGHYAPFGSIEDVVRELGRRPAERFVVYAQDHDQVGNRAVGDRLAPELLRVASSVVLFSAQTPLIFMGEEYGEPNPFQFFTDHVDLAAAEAARKGRRREFAAYSGFARSDVPDPQDPETFARSKLSRRETPGVRDHYRRLLALRRRLPREVQAEVEGPRLTMRRGDATLVADFARKTVVLSA